MLKKVKEEAVLDSGRADFQRETQEHTHLNIDFLTSFLCMLGFNISGRWPNHFTTPAETSDMQIQMSGQFPGVIHSVQVVYVAHGL